MRCEEFRQQLEETGSAASPAARAHAAACPGCARTAATWEEARAALRELGEETPPPFLHARVMAHLRAAEGERAQRPGRRWLFPARVAGALAALVAVSFAGWMAWQVRPEPPAPSAVDERATSTASATVAPEPPAPPALAEADEASTRISEPRSIPSAALSGPVQLRQEKPPAAPAGAAPERAQQAAPATEILQTAAAARAEEATPTIAAPPASPYPETQRQAPASREDVATREQASRRTASVFSAAAPAAAEKASPAIPCTITPRTGGIPTPLALPPGLAPASGEEIALSLYPDGTVALGEKDAERLDPAALREHLRPLGLPP
ncbi:MAG TPA: hypothetical protein VLA75_05720, partial [Thermoanaerobaculia bacterium]|nr:hypothetical protein [Thermoanaerobaculia bacterium]